MNSVMFQFTWPGNQPTLAELADQFDLHEGEIDAEYGVVSVDPRASLYVVRLDASAADRVRSSLSPEQLEAGAGVFADPQIGPIEPPEPESPGP